MWPVSREETQLSYPYSVNQNSIFYIQSRNTTICDDLGNFANRNSGCNNTQWNNRSQRSIRAKGMTYFQITTNSVFIRYGIWEVVFMVKILKWSYNRMKQMGSVLERSQLIYQFQKTEIPPKNFLKASDYYIHSF